MGLIHAVVLYILVSIFSSGTEGSARWKVLSLAILAGVLPLITIRLVPNLLGAILSLVSVVLVVFVGLIYWCQVEKSAALKIAASFLGVTILLEVLARFFL